MAQLLVREVSEDVVRRLKERAKAHGRSVEAEHRLILEAAVRPPLSTSEWAERIASTGVGELDPDELRDRRETGREIDGL
jgi:plasmid stability protein